MADLLIEASRVRGYNSIAFRAAIEPIRISIVTRNATTQATIAERSGQALVEFAIISFVLTAMLAGFLGLIVMGLGSFQNNIAAESAGRLLEGHIAFTKANFVNLFQSDDDDEFLDTDDAENLTARQVYRFLNEHPINDDGDVLYDENRLIISQSDWNNRDSLGLPAINQALLGQYIFDPDLDAYRFPGAVADNQRTGGKTVIIPLLPESADQNGIDRSFYVTSADPALFYPVSDDWVAPVVIGKVHDGDAFAFRIIMFHPSQPASTIQVQVNLDENGRPDRDSDGFYQYPVEADDDAIDAMIGDPPTDYTLAPPAANSSGRASPYGGRFGLGESYAFLKTVRPYRAVFETSSLFRLGASLNPIAVKYEAAMSPIALLNTPPHTTDVPVSPFISYEDNDDQSLNFEQRVVDRFSDGLRRYFVDLPIDPPASSDNDFVRNVLQLQPNDDGVWRVSVAVEFEPVIPPWQPDHLLQLWLYKNGVRERLIATHNVASDHSASVSITKHALIRAEAEDILQVRVLTQGGNEVRLSGNTDSNWVAFERVED